MVAQDQRVFPEGQPLSHDQGHVAMPSCLGNVEETLVPIPGSRVGSFMSLQDANDRCLPHRLGSDLRGTVESRSVEEPSSLMTHQPSGDVGCISCSQEFSSRSQGPPCACPLRQHIGGLLHKSQRGGCGHVHFANWRAKSSCGPKGSSEQLSSLGPTI